jgi:hypothetical protein
MYNRAILNPLKRTNCIAGEIMSIDLGKEKPCSIYVMAIVVIPRSATVFPTDFITSYTLFLKKDRTLNISKYIIDAIII